MSVSYVADYVETDKDTGDHVVEVGVGRFDVPASAKLLVTRRSRSPEPGDRVALEGSEARGVVLKPDSGTSPDETCVLWFGAASTDHVYTRYLIVEGDGEERR